VILAVFFFFLYSFILILTDNRQPCFALPQLRAHDGWHGGPAG
jgi:hypothetical protein